MAGKKIEHDEQHQDMPEPILNPEMFSTISKYNKLVMTEVLAAAYQLIKPHLADHGMAFPLSGKTLHLHPDAPEPCVMAVIALILAEWLPFIVANGNCDEIANSALVVGLSLVPSLRAQAGGKSIAEALATYRLDMENRLRGANYKPVWTPEAEQYARRIYAEVKDGEKISIDAACERTKARLLTEHEIDISKSTLRKYLAGPPTKS